LKHICATCDEPIKLGQTVIQMLSGPNYSAITPAFVKFEAEWHIECFHEFELKASYQPYQCVDCNRRLKFGETIIFFVRGDETDESNTVAERRGNAIFTPKHFPNCPDRE
jgi:hypothetical protein